MTNTFSSCPSAFAAFPSFKFSYVFLLPLFYCQHCCVEACRLSRSCFCTFTPPSHFNLAFRYRCCHMFICLLLLAASIYDSTYSFLVLNFVTNRSVNKASLLLCFVVLTCLLLAYTCTSMRCPDNFFYFYFFIFIFLCWSSCICTFFSALFPLLLVSSPCVPCFQTLFQSPLLALLSLSIHSCSSPM